MKTFLAALLATSVFAQNVQDIATTVSITDGTTTPLVLSGKTYWTKGTPTGSTTPQIDWGFHVILTEPVLPSGSSLGEQEAWGCYPDGADGGSQKCWLLVQTTAQSGGATTLDYKEYTLTQAKTVDPTQKPSVAFQPDSVVGSSTWTSADGSVTNGTETTRRFGIGSGTSCTTATTNAGATCTLILESTAPVTDATLIAGYEANGWNYVGTWGVSGLWDADTSDVVAGVTVSNAAGVTYGWKAAPATNTTATNTTTTESGMSLTATAGAIFAGLATLAF